MGLYWKGWWEGLLDGLVCEAVLGGLVGGSVLDYSGCVYWFGWQVGLY